MNRFIKKTWELDDIVQPDDANRWEAGIADTVESLKDHIENTNNPHELAMEQIPELEAELNNRSLTSHVHANASTTEHGFMSSVDKARLDGITPGTATPVASGIATVGTGTQYARANHVHPAQTTITGNASTATTLQNTRQINGTNFNGSANITTAHWGVARTLTLTGGVMGSISINGSQNVTMNTTIAGNAPSATRLVTPRTINDVSFDGSANISINRLVATNITDQTVNLNNYSFAHGVIEGVWETIHDDGTANITPLPRQNAVRIELYCMRRHSTTDFRQMMTAKFGVDNSEHIRFCNNGTWSPWVRLRLGDNIERANRLAIARNITIGNTTRSFNGTTDLEWTLASIGAATANHTHVNASTTEHGFMSSTDKARLDGITPGTTTPVASGIATVGTGTQYARANHVHPAQTTITGNASTATTLQTTRQINGTNFNGSANITTAHWGVARTLTLAGGVTGSISINGSQNVTMNTTIAENAPSATRLLTPRTINGVSFDGSANISINRLVATNITDQTVNLNNYSFAHGVIEGVWETNHDSGTVNITPLPHQNAVRIELHCMRRRSTTDFRQMMTAKFGIDNSEHIRFCSNGTWSSWVRLRLGNNIEQANRLAVARNITIGNYTQSFNGTESIGFTLAQIGALPVTGGTMTGNLTVSGHIDRGNTRVESNWIGTHNANNFLMRRNAENRIELATSVNRFHAPLDMNNLDITRVNNLTVSGEVRASRGFSSGNLWVGQGTNVNTIRNDAAALSLRGGVVDATGAGTSVSLINGRSVGGTFNIGQSELGGVMTARVWSTAIWDRAMTGTTRSVVVASNGNLGHASSSEKFKLLIQRDIELEKAERILDLEPARWRDKYGVERVAELMTKEANGETVDWSEEEVGRHEDIYGLIAEDVDKVGLGEFVIREDDGKTPLSIAYERLWVMLIPLVRKQRDLLQTQKDKIAELEAQVTKSNEFIEFMHENLNKRSKKKLAEFVKQKREAREVQDD